MIEGSGNHGSGRLAEPFRIHCWLGEYLLPAVYCLYDILDGEQYNVLFEYQTNVNGWGWNSSTSPKPIVFSAIGTPVESILLNIRLIKY
jgi:hypothetical protein